MSFRVLILSIGLLIAACATVPATMDPVQFETETRQISENPSVVASDRALTALLERPDLTPLQRAEVLFNRAETRWNGKFNLPGAIADFDAFIALAPEDARLPAVERDKVFAITEIENAQRRLAQLQNITNWFDDKVLMGDLEDGAARYKSSQLTPNDLHLYMLREAGYVCAGSEAPVHVHGPEPDHAIDASWCPDPADS